MTETPSYLALLSRIAHAEADAECYLNAWAEATPRDDVRQILQTVALREGEHGKAFAKRICELGYSPEPQTESKMAERLPVTSSTTLTDREKFEKLGFGQPTDPAQLDQFTTMFADKNIDIRTGELLGRYIAEERDSGRLFQACYAQLCAEEGSGRSGTTGDGATLTRIERLLEQLVERLPG